MAEAFAAAYADSAWQAIYCSPMSRTRATAAPLVLRVGLEPIIDEGLREISSGEWAALTHDEASLRFPEAYAYWEADTASRGTPGGETAFEVAARAARVLERIRCEQSSGRVLVVSHKATIRIITYALLGLGRPTAPMPNVASRPATSGMGHSRQGDLAAPAFWTFLSGL